MEKHYCESAVRRAMKELEVILKAVAGEIKWIQASDILGYSPRTMRRHYHEYKERGISGLYDQRRGRPSPRKAPFEVVERVLKLYREQYFDFNVKHFHEQLVERHDFTYSYSWLKNVLQEAGMVSRQKGRGGHRQRRPRRPLFGQMVHLDGSLHPWLSLCPDQKQTLLLVVDDATGMNLAALLVRAETTKSCMRLMREVVERHGVPAQIYTDRHSIYWHTSHSGKVDRERPTQFGRAMEELGVEMIPGYSPQARGRSERWNGTWQGRLVAELRLAGIDNLEAANRYIRESFLPEMNRRFSVKASESGSAFVRAGGCDLDRIFSIREERVVSRDNTVKINNLILQLSKSPYREHFVRCRVDVLEGLEGGGYTVVWNRRVIGRYDVRGQSQTTSTGSKRGKKQRQGAQSGAEAFSPPVALRAPCGKNACQ